MNQIQYDVIYFGVLSIVKKIKKEDNTFKTHELTFFIACAHTYYGPDCNFTCSTSCLNQTCDAESGECLKVAFLKSVVLFYEDIRIGILIHIT